MAALERLSVDGIDSVASVRPSMALSTEVELLQTLAKDLLLTHLWHTNQTSDFHQRSTFDFF